MSRGVPILNHIRSRHNPEAVAGMARYGINPHNNFGVSVRELRTMATSIGLVEGTHQRKGPEEAGCPIA